MDFTDAYTPSQLQKKRAEYSSAYALTDLLDWTAENTIGLPIKLAAQTGQKAIPYVGKVLSVVQPSKWYGTWRPGVKRILDLEILNMISL